MARRQARVFALQALFQVDVGKIPVSEALAAVTEHQPEGIVSFARELVEGVVEHLPELDRRLAEVSRQWPLAQMANLDRNLLRLAAYELLFHPDTPAAVIIAEAVSLARTYSTADSGRFVHGILAALAAQVRPQEAPSRDG